ncbi:MAG TPA: DUF5668 domain-containing protein [Terriglobia bacterium]|nr:DUF5668 domain-containing protein [Terriglobia bacterium]
MLGPLLLIVLGVLFLLNNVYPATFRFGRMWPVILIVIGLAKVLDYFQKGQKKPDSQPDSHKEDQ